MRTGSRTVRTLALTLCCTAAAALTGCGGPAREGYAAVGAAPPGPERGAGENVPPRGQVEFQPIASAGSAPSTSASVPTTPGAPGSLAPGGSAQGGATATAPAGSDPAPGTPPAPGNPATAPGAGGAGGGDGTGGGTGSPGTPGTPTPGTGGTGGTGGSGGTGGTGGSGGAPSPPATPATPAALTLSAPARAAASDRWCDRVTVTFTNTGSTAARSGTVGFATHIIGALGIDWATITTTQPLPAPIAGGTSRTAAYTVCVEAWRVPLGMHVETRGVTATWS
ncbi:hypothetical protein AB0F18_00700 [Streptomyces sp. NPDC029216]|uniref:hypothetical protein n=1 Tax=Streptomyces sp. NPDC029216 TaxID=3154701 RepID=UPI0033D9A964